MAVLPENKDLIATLNDSGMKGYCHRHLTAAVVVTKAEPPVIKTMHGEVFPT